MKILAISDTHCEAGQDHRQDALADTDAMFAQVVSIATERNVDLLVHAGDAFHRAKPSPAALMCFKRFCDRLALAGIPMVVVEGNGAHTAAPGQPSAIELYRSGLVHVSRTPETVEIAGVTVCTLPAASLSRLVASQDGGDRGKLQEQAVELLLRSARDLFAEADSSRPRILLAHQMVSGASLPTGLPVEQVGSVVLPLEELERIGFDAIVLGDIHKPQLLFGTEASPTVSWYCGSPMCMDFGEAETEHGCYIMEFGDDVFDGYEYEFVTLEGRRFVTVDADLTGADDHEWDYEMDESDFIAAAISERFPLQEAVLRVRYRATEEQHRRIDHAALLRLIADAGVHKLYGGLQWVPVRETRTRAAGMDESLSPLAALELWLAAENVAGASADGLRELLAGWETA